MTLFPAISLWQPWASLVAVGAKPFETRAYPPPASLIGRRIAIHAAKKPVFPIVCRMDGATLAAIEEALGVADDHRWPRKMPLGAVVCTAVLANAYRCAETIEVEAEAYALVDRWLSPAHPPELPRIPIDPFGDYAPGRWAWWLKDVVAVPEPIPARGRQGWFAVEVGDA